MRGSLIIQFSIIIAQIIAFVSLFSKKVQKNLLLNKIFHKNAKAAEFSSAAGEFYAAAIAAVVSETVPPSSSSEFRSFSDTIFVRLSISSKMG